MAAELEHIVEELSSLAVPGRDSTMRRLPPERELGERLQMSRGALREQLSALELLGFLRRTQGRGTYLDTPGDDFVRSYFTIARRLGYLNDQQFASARVMLEIAVAEADAHVADEAQIAALRADVDSMIESVRRGDHEAALSADITFHTRMSDILDNPIFRLLNRGFSHVLHESIRYRRLEAVKVEPLNEDGNRRTDTVHYDIVDALERHDPEAARAAMRDHFDRWIELGIDPTR